MQPTANIVLVGFMGTGKSAVGPVVARTLRREFIDMDALIERRQGRRIPDIFRDAGESHFRHLERALVKELVIRSNLVIAPGGGIVLNPDNIADFNRHGLVVCLTATPETILERVGRDTHRPLLQAPDRLGRIRELLEERRPLYETIGVRVATDGLTPGAVAERVLALFEAQVRG